MAVAAGAVPANGWSASAAGWGEPDARPDAPMVAGAGWGVVVAAGAVPVTANGWD